MDPKILKILRCPDCFNLLACRTFKRDHQHGIAEGNLKCSSCKKEFPIIRGIPRFVAMNSYADSFGVQWNLFKTTQLDSFSKTKVSEKRFRLETGWRNEDLENRWILDVGCGNGRFLEVCAQSNCQVIGVDISAAIDAAFELFKNKPNVHLIQASIYNLPFAPGSFDKCYCIGVIQHTPDPEKALHMLPKLIKPDGELALTIYEKKLWTKLYGKYFFRLVTKRINPKVLLWMIKLVSPLLFPLTEILFRIPILKRFFQFFIPYANYVDSELTLRQRYTWAILDTFDMLSPVYDNPLTEKFVRSVLEESQCKNIRRLTNGGINLLATVGERNHPPI